MNWKVNLCARCKENYIISEDLKSCILQTSDNEALKLKGCKDYQWSRGLYSCLQCDKSMALTVD